VTPTTTAWPCLHEPASAYGSVSTTRGRPKQVFGASEQVVAQPLYLLQRRQSPCSGFPAKHQERRHQSREVIGAVGNRGRLLSMSTARVTPVYPRRLVPVSMARRVRVIE
jgi:hypothetical protein